MVTNISHLNKTGLLISIKNGAWFESPSERGFTHLAEYCMQRMIIDQCEAAGVNMQSFCVQGETTLDRVRFAIFFAPNDAERVVSIVLECCKNPPFTTHSIRQEMRELRGDFIDSYKNPYFRAGLALIPRFIKRNSSVFGSVWFHLFARGPKREYLLQYWHKLWSASSCDVLLFGT